VSATATETSIAQLESLAPRGQTAGGFWWSWAEPIAQTPAEAAGIAR
jgi:hypothetical protein